jgi:peptide/nickel transport system substrate-binding protein
LFQPLLSVNDSRDGITPILAQDLPERISTDSITILRYTIRPDAKWTDGSPVSTRDIANSFKIIFNPHSELDYLTEYFSFITEIKIISDNQMDFYIEDFSPEKEFMSGDIDVVPSYLFDPDSLLDGYSIGQLLNYDPAQGIDSTLLLSGALNLKLEKEMKAISGSGPYEVVDFETSKNISLRKKENWWGNIYADSAILFKAYPNNLVFKIFSDPLPLSMALRNDELHMA